MDITEAEELLNYRRQERDRVLLHRAQVAEDTRDAVRIAGKAGMPKTRIAELAGVSRQTVHDMLREDKQPLEPHHPVGLGGDNLRAMTREDHERLK